MSPPRVASAIFPRTSTLTGPNFLEILSRELKGVSDDRLTDYSHGDIPNVHVFHAHDHIVGITQEGAVEIHNVFRVGIVHDLQLPDDPTTHFLLRFNMNDLV